MRLPESEVAAAVQEELNRLDNLEEWSSSEFLIVLILLGLES